MTDDTAKIRAKGTESTGLTEDDARRMHGEVGQHYMAIIELKVAQRHGPDAEGKRGVDLTIEQLELAPRGEVLDDHLRNLCRTVYQNRALNSEDAQLTIDTQSDLEPTVTEVVAAGKMHEPHDYLPAEDPGDGCDVCGHDEEDPRHQEQTADVVDGEALDDEDDDPADQTDRSNVVGFSARN